MPERVAEEGNARPSIGGRLAAAIQRPNTARILLLIGIVNAVNVAGHAAARWNLDDFNIHYTSALALRQGINPYITDLTPLSGHLGLTVDVLNHAADTPFFLVVFEPFTLVPPQVAYWIWFAVSAGLLATTLRLLFKRMAELSTGLRTSLLALVLLYVPLAENFYFSQSQVIILFLLTLMVTFVERKRDEAAGVMLGIAALLRAFPLLLVGYLAARRQWRAVAATAATIAIGGALMIAVGGISPTLSFLFHEPKWLTQSGFVGNWSNISIQAFLRRLPYLLLPPSRIGLGVTASRVVAPVASLALIGVAVRETLRGAAQPDDDFRDFSLWLATAILVSPIAWFHYMVLLILPFMLVARAAVANRASSRARWMAVGNYVLSALAIWLHHSLQFGTLVTGSHTPPFNLALAPGPSYLMLVAEWGFFAMVAGYAAIYWFATDIPA